MKVLPTTLPGVVLLELDSFGDARGRFMETFHRERYRDPLLDLGITEDFVQDNFSLSTKGVLRGLHYQLNAPQGKLVHVTQGEIFDVAVDLRRGSSTFGRWFGTILSAQNCRQLWVPPNFAHGFYVTSEQAAVTYKVTQFYAPDDEQILRWNDPQVAIQWPCLDAPSLSMKDKHGRLLDDASLP